MSVLVCYLIIIQGLACRGGSGRRTTSCGIRTWMPTRIERNFAIRRDGGVFGLKKREMLKANTETGVLCVQLDCAEACSQACAVPNPFDPNLRRAHVLT